MGENDCSPKMMIRRKWRFVENYDPSKMTIRRKWWSVENDDFSKMTMCRKWWFLENDDSSKITIHRKWRFVANDYDNLKLKMFTNIYLAPYIPSPFQMAFLTPSFHGFFCQDFLGAKIHSKLLVKLWALTAFFLSFYYFIFFDLFGFVLRII